MCPHPPPPPPTNPQPHQWLIFALIGLIALVVRTVFLTEIYHTPFFNLRLGDARTYHQWAQQIAGGDWLGDKVFYQAPLYPYLLAVIYRVAGDSAMVVRVVQMLMGAGACVLLALAGCAFFGLRQGVVAGLVLAIYAPSIFLECLIQKTALGLLLMTGLLALLGAVSRRRGGGWRCAAAGVLLGLLALTRENAIIFAPLIAVWLIWGLGRTLWRRRVIRVIAFSAGVAGVLLPVGVRNWCVGGEFLITTSQFGTNFYIGNNTEADGTYRALRFGRGDALYERDDATEIAQQRLGRPLKPAEVSDYWFGQAHQFIATHPMRWLKLMGRKLALTFNAAEVPDTEDQHVYAEHSLVLGWLGAVMHFGVLLPAAVIGIVMTLPQWRRLWLLYLLLAGYAMSVVMFYLFARYRFPLAPLLMLFAGAGVVSLVELLRQRRYRRTAVAVACAVAAAITANWPIYDAGPNRALTYVNFAAQLANDQRHVSSAIDFYERAVRIEPGYAKAHNDWGKLLVKLSQFDPAIERFRVAVQLQPDYIDAHYGLAAAYHVTGRLDEAVKHYRLTLDLDPLHLEARNELGIVLARQGLLTEATEQFERVLQTDPEHSGARDNLERARKMLGDDEPADGDE